MDIFVMPIAKVCSVQPVTCYTIKLCEKWADLDENASTSFVTRFAPVLSNDTCDLMETYRVQ